MSWTNIIKAAIITIIVALVFSLTACASTGRVLNGELPNHEVTRCDLLLGVVTNLHTDPYASPDWINSVGVVYEIWLEHCQ